jgi:hypothetical protein
VKKVRCYIDGFNLYHAIEALKKPHLKWLNLMKLAESFIREGEILDEVHFFTALSTSNGQKYKRHTNYMAALESVGVKVHRGEFQSVSRFCNRHERMCPFQEEKRTDVGIAVKCYAMPSMGQGVSFSLPPMLIRFRHWKLSRQDISTATSP